MRKKIVAGNWKMNLNRKAAFQLIETIDSLKFSNNVEVIIAPPSIYLESFLGKVKNFNISSQDVSANDNGAYTGEFSAAMLSSLSLKYSIVGHSERRLYHGETEEMIFNKAKQLLKSNMSPIYCCGELLEDRKSENHFKVVASQLQPLLDNLNSDELEKFIIAYEPVWAIGTGLTAKPSDAQDMHSYIRALIKEKFSSSIADQISIIYGGSCKPDNAKELFSMEDVDGGLIGGASLDADSFSAIINSF
ncbi:MAG: triose-phosphate isomerase [Flavobacteriales bacterium]|jgi:triosephosphate isomerase|nr:triose-phosphate isomerase [Flavobacteriales bacterium]